ncbi:LuxR C-terminal-related transcriptional regulator [Prescottella sp. R16]|uniref:helix-turn-helix transcriptional regulator n=1 Tax=Prescottella sp. R16 TaxID=3064529 RepID=UPI00272E18A0|nr:LuxR C-terminal-related transcriptional regulator [Prescottella sp. R16]
MTTTPRSRTGVPTSRAVTSALPRPRLFELLDRAADLTVIQAPSGFGKTTLVASWLHAGGADGRDVCWIDAEESGRPVTEMLDSVVGVPPPAATLLVVDSLEASDSAAVMSRVAQLLDRYPSTAAVMCVRGAVELPLSVMTGGIRCVTVHAADLAFTVAETAALCRSVENDLTDPQCQDLCTTLRGIPALVSAAVSLLGTFPGPAVDRYGHLMPVPARLVDEYVADRLAGLDEWSRDLAPMAAASRTPGPDAVAALVDGGAGAAERLLERLDAAGLVVGTYDGKSRSWWWPEAIRQALLTVSRREQPGQVDAVMSQLAHRSLEAGRFADAAGYATDAADWPMAARIVEDHWSDMVAGHFELLVHILRTLPDETADENSSVAAGKALFVQSLAGHPLLNVPIPATPKEAVAAGARPDAADLLHIGTVQSVGLRMTGRLREGANRATQLVPLVDSMLAAQPENVTSQLPTVELQWAISMQLAGDLESATALFTRACRGGWAANYDFVVLNAAGSIALNWALVGDLPRTAEWLATESRVDTNVGYWDEMIRVGGRVAATLAHLDRLEFEAAHTILEVLGTPKSREELWGFVAYAVAQYGLATGDAYSGLTRLHHILAGHRELHQPGGASHVLLTAAEIDLHLALGNSTAARALTADTDSTHPVVAVAVARLELLTGHPDTARQQLAHVSWTRSGWLRAQVEALAIEAASYLDDRPDLAVQAWNRACAGAGRLGNRRALTALPARYVAALTALDGAATPDSTVPSVFPDTVSEVSLSPRELAVLELLEAGHGQRAIATELFVSLNTVKTQLRSIYRKLDVHSGADAVTRARQLRLLDR